MRSAVNVWRDRRNQAGRYSYGEATGITQTIRNYAASLGLAQMQNSGSSCGSGSRSGPSGNGAPDLSQIPHFSKMAFAQSTETIFYAMAGIMAVAAIVAFVGLKGGVAPEEAADAA